MRYYRYKASFKGDHESEATFWYLRITALATIAISAYWVSYTNNYFFLLLGLFIGVFAFSALSINNVRRFYYVFYGLLSTLALVAFIAMCFLYSYIQVLIALSTLAYGILQLALGIVCFPEDDALI